MWKKAFISLGLIYAIVFTVMGSIGIGSWLHIDPASVDIGFAVGLLFAGVISLFVIGLFAIFR